MHTFAEAQLNWYISQVVSSFGKACFTVTILLTTKILGIVVCASEKVKNAVKHKIEHNTIIKLQYKHMWNEHVRNARHNNHIIDCYDKYVWFAPQCKHVPNYTRYTHMYYWTLVSTKRSIHLMSVQHCKKSNSILRAYFDRLGSTYV